MPCNVETSNCPLAFLRQRKDMTKKNGHHGRPPGKRKSKEEKEKESRKGGGEKRPFPRAQKTSLWESKP